VGVTCGRDVWAWRVGVARGSAAHLQQLHQPLLANVQLMQHDERLGRAADASHQARGRGPRALRLLRQLVPTGGAVHVPEWLGRRSVKLGPGSTALESDHRAIQGKHSHNDDEDDEDKEGSPSESAQLRLSGEHSWRARSFGVRSYNCRRPLTSSHACGKATDGTRDQSYTQEGCAARSRQVLKYKRRR